MNREAALELYALGLEAGWDVGYERGLYDTPEEPYFKWDTHSSPDKDEALRELKRVFLSDSSNWEESAPPPNGVDTADLAPPTPDSLNRVVDTFQALLYKEWPRIAHEWEEILQKLKANGEETGPSTNTQQTTPLSNKCEEEVLSAVQREIWSKIYDEVMEPPTTPPNGTQTDNDTH